LIESGEMRGIPSGGIGRVKMIVSTPPTSSICPSYHIYGVGLSS
jgi:hypothetical protein